MHRFRKLGYCANPDPAAKGLLFASKNKELKDKVELEGEEIGTNHQEFLEKMYEKTTNKAKK